MELSKKQTIALDILEDHTNNVVEVIYGGSAGSGKSIIGCYWLLKQALKYKETRWLLGRSVLKTLKQTTLQSFFEVCKIQGLEPDTHYNYYESKGEIHLYNGSIIILADLAYYPADPDYDRLGGLEITGGFIDEIAQIRHKAWTVVLSRIRYKLDEYNIEPKLFGSLNPTKNWVYTYFYKPLKDGTIEKERAFIQALPTDNPHLSKSNLKLLSRLPKAERDRLFLGKWESDADNQMITNDAISDIYTNSFVQAIGNKYITIDVARKGKDKSIVMLWQGLIVTHIWEYSKLALTELAENVKKIANEHKVSMSRVIADESGVGGGLVDILKCKGFIGGSKSLKNENYLNLRTQCFYYLAKYINENKIWIKADLNGDTITLISQELEQIMSEENDGEGKLRIIPKSEIKSNIGRSPDYSDTLSMRMYFEIDKNSGVYHLI